MVVIPSPGITFHSFLVTMLQWHQLLQNIMDSPIECLENTPRSGHGKDHIWIGMKHSEGVQGQRQLCRSLRLARFTQSLASKTQTPN